MLTMIKHLSTVLRAFVITVFSFMILVVLVSVIARCFSVEFPLFSQNFQKLQFEELLPQVLALLCFLVFPYADRAALNPSFTLIVKKNPSLARWFPIFEGLAGLTVWGILSFSSIKVMLFQIKVQSITAQGFSQAWFTAFFVIGCISMLLRQFSRFRARR